jgi:5,10-methylenetetrahydrofolate reductase
MVVVAERNTTPDAIISIYKIVHAMGKTQLGGVRGDWFKDLYQAEDAEASEAEDFILYLFKTL